MIDQDTLAVFDTAERSCLTDLSAGTFRPDAPDLTSLRWQVTNMRQQVAAACLVQWGVVTYDHASGSYRLTPAGIARAQLTAREAPHHG